MMQSLNRPCLRRAAQGVGGTHLLLLVVIEGTAAIMETPMMPTPMMVATAAATLVGAAAIVEQTSNVPPTIAMAMELPQT